MNKLNNIYNMRIWRWGKSRLYNSRLPKIATKGISNRQFSRTNRF